MTRFRVAPLWAILAFSLAFFCGCDPQVININGAKNSSSEVPQGNQASSPPTNGDALTGTSALDDEETAFFTLINEYRAQNGIPAFQLSIALTRSSDWMSQDMAAKNYFSHTDSLGRDPFARMTAFGYDYSWEGENIAAGNATAQDTFTQWKNSAGHNANMLSSNYRVIGIARAQSPGSAYGWYWTTDFGGTVDATVVP